MKRPISPVLTAAVLAVLVILVGIGVYRAAAPPVYDASHGDKAYGNHLPPTASPQSPTH